MQLLPGLEYTWFVTVVPDPEERSKDIISGGAIQFVEPAKALADKWAGLQGADLAKAYAEASYWYDAVEATMKLDHAKEGREGYRVLMPQLLKQAGLPVVVE